MHYLKTSDTIFWEYNLSKCMLVRFSVETLETFLEKKNLKSLKITHTHTQKVFSVCLSCSFLPLNTSFINSLLQQLTFFMHIAYGFWMFNSLFSYTFAFCKRFKGKKIFFQIKYILMWPWFSQERFLIFRIELFEVKYKENRNRVEWKYSYFEISLILIWFLPRRKRILKKDYKIS